MSITTTVHFILLLYLPPDASDFLDKMIGHFEEHVPYSSAFVREFGAVVTSQTIRKCGHSSSRNEHHHSIDVVVQVRVRA